uniref:Uncharacterized protein n=1 Tax=Myotis myotis TaxID=51298 RepID=A0A7J7VII4_MYOMY|nr:hypothetical protein mMyoMyo1_008284 [Myotis myotis]
MFNCSSAGLIAPNCPPLPAWLTLTALPCWSGCPQLPFTASPIAPNCHPLQAWLPQLPSPAGLVPPNCPPLQACPPNCPPLQAWSLPTALPCRPSCGGHLVCWSGGQFAYYSFIRYDYIKLNISLISQ